jgi:predicted nucleotidyltransferase
VITDLQRQNQVLVERLRAVRQDLVAVYRFGSTAHGTATSASDVDIAFLTRDRVTPAERFDLQEALAAAIGSDVDLVDLASASTVLAIQVVAYGDLLYDADSDARGRFEDRTFGAYARLNEERRGILERVAAEGTVYGR